MATKKTEAAPKAASPQLRTISFRADDKTMAALKQLEAAQDESVRKRQSIAIRKAIRDAAERLKK